MSEALVRIENTKLKFIDLIASGEFPLKTLLPGDNNVPLRHVIALKDHPPTRWYFDQKWLVLHKEGEGGKEGPRPPESLAFYEKEEGAILIVNATTDLEALTMWAGNEDRPAVVAAIQAQMKKVG